MDVSGYGKEVVGSKYAEIRAVYAWYSDSLRMPAGKVFEKKNDLRLGFRIKSIHPDLCVAPC